MIIKKYDSEESWLEDRIGKITGSKLKDIVVKKGTNRKIGFYQLIADRISLLPTEENPMERGKRLEKEAIEMFEKETGIKVDSSLLMWQREDNPNIAYSPDGVIDEENCVEVKCLSSARHVEALLTTEIPDEYEFQKLQVFIVNEKLQTLYFCFYDPRLTVKQFFYIIVNRKDIQEDIDKYLEYERKILEEVNIIVNELSF